MSEGHYTFIINSDDDDARAGNQAARNLLDELREIDGVIEADRRKQNDSNMDVGMVVNVIATSGAVLAIARGIADWIRKNRRLHLVIERNAESGSIKAEINNADAATALRVTELIVSQ
jgi:hypothetical protein